MPKWDPSITLSRGGESLVLGSEYTDDGYILKQGVTGLGIAPTENTLTEIPSGHGSLLRSSRLGAREIFLPVFVYGNSYAQVDKRRDRLFALLDPTKGPVRVSVKSRTRGGETRWVDAVYAEGLDGDYGDDFKGYYHHIGLKLQAPDAFWYSDSVSRLFQLDPGKKPFISDTEKFFPVVLYSSSIAGRFNIHIKGDQTVYPVFTVTGPGNDLIIECNGKKIHFEGDVAIGRRITFDAAKGDVYDKDNTNGELWSRMSLDSDFFELQPGDNTVTVSFTGATVDSLLELSYMPRYLVGY